MNLNLLAVLDALLESVSGAARKLNLSQPAISRSLSQLRRQFGDPLFVRSSHGMVATARAEALTAPLQEVLQATLGLFEAAPFDPAESMAIFRIATTDYGAIAALAPTLKAIMTAAPKAGFELVTVDRGSFAKMTAGEIDLALYANVERRRT